MSKIILFNPEASEKLKKGADKLANAVKTTLGPRGRNVIIEKKFGPPQITKDGVTVAKEVELKDPIENMGAKVVREVASHTNDDIGDGTTTATVLAQAIISESFRSVGSGANVLDVQQGIQKAVEKVVGELRKQGQKIKKPAEIKQIATISANNDEKIGSMIADAIQNVGKDGAITVEEAKSTDTKVEVVEGMQFDKGYHSPYFVTNAEKMTADLDNPYILLVEKKISSVQEILPVLEIIAKEGRQLLIIADDFDTQAISTLVVNQLRGRIKAVAVKAPAFGDRKKAILRDIAILTGGQVIGGEEGYTLEGVQRSYLGSAEKVNITKDSTTIVNGKGAKSNIKGRIKELAAQIELTDSEYDREKLQERKAKLAGGVAILYVGGATEVEVKEKKDRVHDALNATRAALEEGILPGGGVALLRASSVLATIKEKNEDVNRGIKIVERALEAPIRTILQNALGRDYYEVLQKVKEGKDNYGYNARTGTFGNLHQQGVIDPVKVTRVALENSASASSLLMTTECVITDDPAENKEPSMPAPPMGGGMGGMM
ncbi:MAG: chaperonin GroEL [Bacteroidota bacterium]